MRAGPKAMPTGALDLSSLPSAGSDRVAAFIETFCRVPKGSKGAKARTRIRLRPWQRDILDGLYGGPDGSLPRPRQGLVSVARKNGKSLLASALALYALYADGEESAEVIVVSSDERTARVIFHLARRMVELSPDLLGVTQIFADRLYVPSTDSVLEALPAEATRLQGRNPSVALVDELHCVAADTWDAVALAGGSRLRPLCLALSTAAGDTEGVMWRLTEYGRLHPQDTHFFFAEYAAPAECALDDRAAWAAANPQLGDTLDPDHLAATLKTARPEVFRRYHLNQFVTSGAQWLPDGAWAACADPSRVLADGAEVVLAFDGSHNGDATALVLATVEPSPFLDVVGLWERQPSDAADWCVDVLEVEEAIREACRKYNVREIIADPFRWTRSLQVLASERLPCVEMPQSATRMTPATVGAYEAVANNALTHSGDPDLARHVANATVKTDARGTRLAKQSRSSTRRIDLAVAAVMAHSRASHLATSRRPSRKIHTF